MTEASVIVRNYPGIHAHPAGLFVKRASGFRSSISIISGDLTVNGKSIMGLMMLAANCGSVIKVSAEGADAEAALAKIGALIDGGFMEESSPPKPG